MKYVVTKSALSLLLIFVLALLTIGIILPSKEGCVVTVPTENANISCMYNQVVNLKNWDNWSVWHHLDPNMTKTYSDTTEGVGASYSWSGNDQVGKGSLRIAEAEKDKKLKMTMIFEGYGESYSIIQFDTNKITWTMPIEKPSSPIVNFLFGGYSSLMMDYFLKKDFEQNLKNLKSNCK